MQPPSPYLFYLCDKNVLRQMAQTTNKNRKTKMKIFLQKKNKITHIIFRWFRFELAFLNLYIRVFCICSIQAFSKLTHLTGNSVLSLFYIFLSIYRLYLSFQLQAQTSTNFSHQIFRARAHTKP